MATLDSLEIKIQSDAKGACGQLDILAQKLGVIARGLSSIQTGDGLDGFAKKAETVSQKFNGMQAKMESALKPMEKQAQKASKSLERIYDDHKDLGKGITFAGSTATLQKQLDSYTNLLEKAKLREAELGAGGKTNGQMYEYAIRDILKYSNIIEGLREQLKTVNTESSMQKLDLTITGMDESTQSLGELKNSLKEMQGLLSEGYGGGILENLQIELEEVKARFPEATQTIQEYEEAIKTAGEMSSGASKKIRDAADSLESIRNPGAEAASGPDAYIPKLSDKMRDLVKQAQVASGIKIYTDDHKKIKADIDRTEKSLEKLDQKKRDMEAGGVSAESREWGKVAAQIAAAKRQLDVYNGKKNLMEYKGQDIQSPAINLAGMQKSVAALSSIMKKVEGAFSRASLAIKKIGSVVSAAISKVAGLGKAMLNVGKSSKKMDVSLTGGFKTILKYTLGIRSFYVLMGRFRTAVKEGFQNLAQYSGEANTSLSMLMSSLTQLKNSFAAAFAPILNFVTPALNTLIQTVAKAMNTVGQFFSALTGKSSAVQAVKVSQDYAASLADTGDSAKDTQSKIEDLAESLSVLGFDELNQLSDTSKGADAAGGAEVADTTGLTPQDMFDTVPIESGIKDFAEKIKSAWKNADFTEIGSMLGGKLKSALEDIPWDDIKDTAAKVGKSLATLINGFVETDGLGYTIGDTIAQAINTGLTGLNEFAKNLHWDSVGTFLADGINGVLENIDWETALSAAHYLGTGIATMLNNALTPEVFDNIGYTIGMGINTALTFVNDFLTTLNWKEIGEGIGGGSKRAIDMIDWGLLGEAVGNAVGSIFGLFEGFVESKPLEGLGSKIATAINEAVKKIDLGSFASSLSEFVISFLGELSTAIQETDWEGVGQEISDALKGIDWVGIAAGLFDVGLQLIGGILDAFGELPLPVQIAGTAIGGFLAVMGGMSVITSVCEATGHVINSYEPCHARHSGSGGDRHLSHCELG